MGKASTIYKAFFDCETTGLDPWRNDIISYHLIITDSNNEILKEDTFHSRPNEVSWSVDAEKIHKISLREAMGFPRPEVMADSFNEFMKEFKGDYIPFHYHAKNNFDYRFLFATFFKIERHFDIYQYFMQDISVSTIDMAKQAGHKRVGLNALCEHYQIKLDHHNAKSDCTATLELYKKLTSSIV